jgi:hypothetical protein
VTALVVVTLLVLGVWALDKAARRHLKAHRRYETYKARGAKRSAGVLLEWE